MLSSSENLIDRIYEAAAVPELWPETIEAMAEHAGGVGGYLCADYSHHSGNGVVTGSVRPLHVTAAETGIKTSGYTARIMDWRPGRFVGDLDVFTSDELSANPYYRKILRPSGYGWCAGSYWPCSTGEQVLVRFERRFDDGPVSAEEMARLDALWPHLGRAGRLFARIGAKQARTMVEVLQGVGLAAAVINTDGRILAVNDDLEALQPRVTSGRTERIAFSDKPAQAKLNELLTHLKEGRTSQLATPIPIPGAPGQPAAVAHLIPARGTARDVLGSLSAILIVTTVTSTQAPSIPLLQAAYNLTPAEARVASNLAMGGTLPQIASELGVSLNTVKAQLKAVFEKTGTNRQASLVSLLSSLRSLPRS